MILVHVFDKRTDEIIDIYFINKRTGNKVDYSVEEFKNVNVNIFLYKKWKIIMYNN